MSEVIINSIKEKINETLKCCDEIISKTASDNMYFDNVLVLIDKIESLSSAVMNFKNGMDNVRDLNDVLKNLVDSLEDNDIYLFSDLTKYELKPLLVNWLTTIN